MQWAQAACLSLVHSKIVYYFIYEYKIWILSKKCDENISKHRIFCSSANVIVHNTLKHGINKPNFSQIYVIYRQYEIDQYVCLNTTSINSRLAVVYSICFRNSLQAEVVHIPIWRYLSYILLFTRFMPKVLFYTDVSHVCLHSMSNGIYITSTACRTCDQETAMRLTAHSHHIHKMKIVKISQTKWRRRN